MSHPSSARSKTACLIAAMLSLLPLAAAQELGLGGSLCLAGRPPPVAPAPRAAAGCDVGAFSVGLKDARVGGTTVGVELSYRLAERQGGPTGGSGGGSVGGPAGGSGDVAAVGQLALGLAANEAFGPLGNVVFELTGALRTDGLAQGTLGARGVLGPVAARLALGAHGADAAAFAPLALASDDRPSFGGFSAGLRLGLTARLERNLIVEADPELYLTTDGLAGRLTGRLRLLRALGDDELRVHLRAGATPGFERAYAAVGAGVNFPRGREPDIDVAVHLGAAGGRLWPGVTVDLAENLAGGLRVSLAAAVEPYRLDVHPGRARLSLTAPLGRGRLELAAAGAFLDAERPAAAAIQTAFFLPVALPATGAAD